MVSLWVLPPFSESPDLVKREPLDSFQPLWEIFKPAGFVFVADVVDFTVRSAFHSSQRPTVSQISL